MLRHKYIHIVHVLQDLSLQKLLLNQYLLLPLHIMGIWLQT